LGISEELLGTHWGPHQALEENVKNPLRTGWEKNVNFIGKH
jgi:hypothetical protein